MENTTESSGSFTASILRNTGSSTVIWTSILGILALGILYAQSKLDTLDADEPPLLKSRIPFCGHLIGMLRWQVGYFSLLSSKVPSSPAFTLRIFSSRIYVLADPSLIQSAYRNTKAFDFGQFVVESSQRAFNIGEAGMKIIRGETSPDYHPNGPYLNGNKGESFLNENHKIMVESLTPGSSLSELNQKVLQNVAGCLNAVEGEESVGLYRWIRDELTLATADAFYGRESPLNGDHSLIDCLWDFEENMTLLMLSILPTLLAPKAYTGRARIKSAFTTYYASNHHLSASTLIQSRLANSQKWGFTLDDIANFEISTLFLATTNTVPTSFWQLCYILSDSELLEKIREEVESIVTTREGEKEAVMDITLFATHCPLLVASFHETLRLVDGATSVRNVVSPTVLTSSTNPSQSYILHTPAVIQLPSGITHLSPTIWGADVLSFNPTRFLPSTTSKLEKTQRQAQKMGFFPFGGGKHLCPGRHFAMMEVLSFVAGMLVGFEISSDSGSKIENGDGEKEVKGNRFKVPEMAFQKLGTAVRKPVRDVDVRLWRREGWEGVRWRFDDVGKGGAEGKVNFKGLAVGDGGVEEGL